MAEKTISIGKPAAGFTDAKTKPLALLSNDASMTPTTLVRVVSYNELFPETALKLCSAELTSFHRESNFLDVRRTRPNQSH